MARSLVSPTGKAIKLAALHPNAGLTANYQKRIDRLVDEMHASVAYWLTAAYKANTPEISQLAQDGSPAAALNEIMRKLALRWNRKFRQASTELGLYFGQQVKDRTDAQLKAILKRGGFAIKFDSTRAANDVVQATIAENVSLIRSIGSEYLSDVQQMVNRSVSTGRDIGGLTEELEKRYGITRRRAKIIAHTSNNQASSALSRVRYAELGLQTAIWRHAGGGREPRPSHVAQDGGEFNMAEGWYDPHEGRHIWPGTLISCRCVAIAIIPALRDEQIKRLNATE